MGWGVSPSLFLTTTTNKKDMKQHGSWNTLSPEAYPKKLKKGEKVTYRLLGIQGDLSNLETFKCPAMKNVPPKDRIVDPITNDFVDIASIKNIGVGGKLSFYDIVFERDFNGILILDGSKISDHEMYEYLELTNYNASNPNRSEDVVAIFEKVDHKAKSEGKRKERTTKRQALNAAAEMSAADVRNFVAAMGWSDDEDLVILRDKVEEYAESNPAEFIKKSKNKQNTIHALVNRAAKKGVIKFAPTSNSWVWSESDETICSVARGSQAKETLVAHLVDSPNGAEVMKTLQSALK